MNILRNIGSVAPILVIAAAAILYGAVLLLWRNTLWIFLALWASLLFSFLVLPSGQSALRAAENIPSVSNKVSCLVQAAINGVPWDLGSLKNETFCQYHGLGTSTVGQGISISSPQARALRKRYGG